MISNNNTSLHSGKKKKNLLFDFFFLEKNINSID